MNYWIHLLSMAVLYASLGISLNILVGYVGILSVCHAAFFGIGAYATAILTTTYAWSWPSTVSVGICIACIAALGVGRMSMRLRHDHVVVVTFVLQIVVFRIMQNWNAVTSGSWASMEFRPFAWECGQLGVCGRC